MTNIAILASGNGTNAEHIALTFEDSREINVAIAVTNRADAGVIGRMNSLGISVEHVPDNVWRENPGEIVGLLRRHKVDLIVLAGFLKYIDPVIIDAFPSAFSTSIPRCCRPTAAPACMARESTGPLSKPERNARA